MDESTRLIAELHSKLQYLDDKVAAYRQDMALEYTKYAEVLMSNVSDDVSSRVKNVIAGGMSSFPSLVPAFPGCGLPSKADDAGTSHDRSNASEPTISQNAADTSDIPGSPHSREAELTGLFTPSYLPLLDSNDRNERRSSSDISPGLPPASAPVAFERPIERASAPSTMSSSYEPGSSIPKPPALKRRNTDEVSLRSGTSDDPKPRSALRRTSSSSVYKAQSPRRVRFEFEGEEFTTTSSPNPPVPIEEMLEEKAAYTESSLLDFDDDDDDDEEAGSAFVENIEDTAPAKRVSSSQALRNLSRGPIEDDGTNWTELIAPPDGSASVEGSVEDSEEGSEGAFDMSSKKKANAATTSVSTEHNSTDPELTAEEAQVLSKMEPLQSMRSTKSLPYALTPSSPSAVQVATVQATEVLPVSHDDLMIPENGNRNDVIDISDDEDEMFGFEENPNRMKGKYLEHEASDEEPTELDESIDPLQMDLLTRSETPRRDIVPRKAVTTEPIGSVPGVDVSSQAQQQNAEDHGLNELRPESPIHFSQATNPSNPFSSSYNILPPPLVSTSLRPSSFVFENESSRPSDPEKSQKRRVTPIHPFSTPVIDPTLHSKLSKVRGQRSSFVGSVTGNSGLDESNAQDQEDDIRIKEMARSMGEGGVFGSFKDAGLSGSLAGGGPRSLSERMRLEEYMEGRSSH